MTLMPHINVMTLSLWLHWELCTDRMETFTLSRIQIQIDVYISVITAQKTQLKPHNLFSLKRKRRIRKKYRLELQVFLFRTRVVIGLSHARVCTASYSSYTCNLTYKISFHTTLVLSTFAFLNKTCLSYTKTSSEPAVNRMRTTRLEPCSLACHISPNELRTRHVISWKSCFFHWDELRQWRLPTKQLTRNNSKNPVCSLHLWLPLTWHTRMKTIWV